MSTQNGKSLNMKMNMHISTHVYTLQVIMCIYMLCVVAAHTVNSKRQVIEYRYKYVCAYVYALQSIMCIHI